MPLCTDCKSEAEVSKNGVTIGGERTNSKPPHGMDWGESCDRCSNAAYVTFGSDK